ncbi:MAG: serine/threonine-protein phosphatase [Clostridiales bacterium]|nr:serine/threonine-protein phosphatase [Clostridiales bacterium]
MGNGISVADLINILFIALGLGICTMSIMQMGTGMHIQKDAKVIFQQFFTVINIYISMHLIRMIAEGHTGTLPETLTRASTFIEYLVSGIMIYMLSLLILYVASPGKMGHVINVVFLVLMAIHVIGLIVNLFTNFYYTFDEFNVYHRARGYGYSNIMHLLMLSQNIFLLIKYRKKFDKRLARALWIYLISPIFALALQFFFPGVQFVILVTVISAGFLNLAVIMIQGERYENQRREKNRIDTELTMATRIQAETLPNIFPAFPERDDFNIFASMNPAKEVGGDFYDFFLIDESHLGLVVADVSGKGIPAALFMMVSKIMIQNIAMMGSSPAEVLRFVNNQLCSNNPEEMFVSVWYGCLDLETGILTAANAGHEYPVLKQPDGNFQLVRDRHQLVIGGMEGIRYTEYEIQLDPGAKLFLYTDGIPEAANADNKFYGIDRLVETLVKNEEKSPQEIIKSVGESVKAYVKDAPQFDDLTMLCLEYAGSNKPS